MMLGLFSCYLAARKWVAHTPGGLSETGFGSLSSWAHPETCVSAQLILIPIALVVRRAFN